MAILPNRIQDLLDFAELHAPIWVTRATTIGLTSGQAIAFTNAASEARDAYTTRLAAISAAKVATMAQSEAVSELRRIAGETLMLIKTHAEISADPNGVYTAAEIPAPLTPSPLAPPGTPFDFKATLDTDGSITLNWKCANPAGASGTVYQVRRKLDAETSFELLGTVGARTFTDDTLPSGTSTAQYVITGQRAGSVGAPSSPFTVMFGTAGGSGGAEGFTIAGQFEGDQTPMPMKKAA